MHSLWVVLILLAPGAAMWISFFVTPGHWTTPIYVASKLAVLALPLWLVRVRPGPPAPLMKLDVLTGIGVGVGISLLIVGLYYGVLQGRPELSVAAEVIRAKLHSASVDSPGRFAAMALFVSIGNSAIEEYFWRWFGFGQLRTHWPPLVAALASSLLFGVHHLVVLIKYFAGSAWTIGLPLATGTVLGGVIWCLIYHLRGSLYANWVSHIVIDVVIMLVAYDMLWGAA